MTTVSPRYQLHRRLGFWESLSIVVGVVIGTGIFLKTSVIAQTTGSSSIVLAAWILAGFLSLLGALTYAELAALFPQTGGEYVFLREAYGDLPAFLYGWTRFWIISPGSVAAYAVGAATFLEAAVPLVVPRVAVSIAFLALFTGINCLSVLVSGRLQNFLTLLKVVMIVGLTLILFIMVDGSLASLSNPSQSLGTLGLNGFGAAILAALWAFDGWSNLPLAAGEVRNPQTNLPRALIGGLLLVLALYLSLNVAYFYVLSFEEVATSSSTMYPEAPSVAAKAAGAALGPSGVFFLSLLFVVSALGAMNASILTGARVPFAMASDKLFFPALAGVSSGSHVPVISVVVQGGIAMVLASAGTFDQLTDYVVFAAWIFYALVGASIFVFRARYPQKVRPFKVPFYPWLPILFIGLSILLLSNTLWTSPVQSGIGVAMIASGVPLYLWFRSKLR